MNVFINISRAVIILLMVIFPILSVMNCSNWSEATGHASNCYINAAFLKEYASLTGGLIFISIWTGFIPLILYIGLCFLLLFGVPWYIKRGINEVKSSNGDIYNNVAPSEISNTNNET